MILPMSEQPKLPQSQHLFCAGHMYIYDPLYIGLGFRLEPQNLILIKTIALYTRFLHHHTKFLDQACVKGQNQHESDQYLHGQTVELERETILEPPITFPPTLGHILYVDNQFPRSQYILSLMIRNHRSFCRQSTRTAR